MYLYTRLTCWNVYSISKVIAPFYYLSIRWLHCDVHMYFPVEHSCSAHHMCIVLLLFVQFRIHHLCVTFANVHNLHETQKRGNLYFWEVNLKNNIPSAKLSAFQSHQFLCYVYNHRLLEISTAFYSNLMSGSVVKFKVCAVEREHFLKVLKFDLWF